MQNEEIFKLAAKLLNKSVEELQNNYKELPDDNAICFWEPWRGGRSFIIHNDGTFLFTPSAVPPNQALERFRDGERTEQK